VPSGLSTGLETKNATPKGEIDAKVMQHTVFLNSYNEPRSSNLVGIVHVLLTRKWAAHGRREANYPARPVASVED
jgi:D-methionine transport system substrate-binding protein